MASLLAEPTSQGETKDPAPTADDIKSDAKIATDPTPTADDDEEEEANYIVSETKSIKDLLAADADDVALQKYKESLIGTTATVDGAIPVEIIELRLLFAERAPLIIPFNTTEKQVVHVLKENEQYICQLIFKVNNEIVSGLKFNRIITRSGIRVDKETIMVGSFAPNAEPIVFKLEEDIVPGGFLSRGTYTSKIKLQGKAFQKNIILDLVFILSLTFFLSLVLSFSRFSFRRRRQNSSCRCSIQI